ncbi:MAG: thioesterase [Bacillota bacterium]|nr:thioesterase [Bacillota bacterium]
MIINGKELIEHEQVYRVKVEVNHLNENRILMPQSYQLLFAQMVEQDLDRFQANLPDTRKYGLAWALISIGIEVVRPINDCIWLNASTWYSQKRGPYFRRELQFRDEAGDVMFQGTTYSILLDLEKRSVFRKKEAPFHMDPPHMVFCAGGDPHFKEELPFETVEERTARSSDIDALGHVNNCRYGAFAYDVLTEEEKDRLARLKRIDYYFVSELTRGSVFPVQKAATPERIAVRGLTGQEGAVAFDVVMSF